MRKFLLAALAGLCAFAAWALDYKTVDIRRTGGSPVRETFWAGDTIAFGYSLEEDSSSYDLSPWDMVTWELCTYTNPAQCWMGVTGRVDDAESGELSVETTLPLSVVPEGQYRGYVKGLKLAGTNVTSQRVLVEQVVTVRYGQTEFPPDVEDNGGIIEGNAYVRQSALDAETEARIGGDAALSNAVAAISGDPAYYGGMVVKTNGLWVIDQQEGRTALEWNGTPVLEAVAPTNASETATGAVMVATAPLYVGEVGESNRVATVGEIGNLPTPGTAFDLVTNQSFTNYAFPRGITLDTSDIPDITQQGLPNFNFNGLASFWYANSTWVGLFGYPCVGLFGLHGSFQVNRDGPYVVGGLGFAGSSSRLAVTDGELTFGGEPIGGGIPNIEAGKGIAVAISTDNVATVSTALTAGHGITISTNDQNTVLAIAVPRSLDFDNVTIRGNLSIYGTEYKTTTIIITTNVYRGTNYIDEVRYSTNYVAQHTVVYEVTRTTNTVDEVVTIGGTVDHSRAELVKEPSFSIDNADTNAPVLTATGEWDFTLAAVDFGTNLPDLYADRVVQPMTWLTNGTIALQPDVSIYAATPDSGTIFEVDLSALGALQDCAITFEMLLDLGASVSNVSFMSTNTLSWLEGDAPAIPQGARSILVFRTYDMTNWIGNLQGILP